MKILRPWYWIAFATLFAVLDQASKAVIEIWLPLHNSMPVAENFNLVHVLNPGAAFSFLADQAGWQRLFLAGIAAFASVFLVVLIVRKPRFIEATAYSLILGGAVGNLVDRIVRGAVVDWLDFYVNHWHWPAFNLADVWIVIGAGLLILSGFKQRARQPPQNEQSA